MTHLLSFFTTNQFASGGLIMVLFGGILASLRNVPKQAWNYLKNRIGFFQVTVRSDDPLYPALETWISKYSFKTKNYRVLTRADNGSTDSYDLKGGNTAVVFSLGTGEHFFHYDGAKMWTTIEYEENKGNSSKLISNITLHMRNGSREKFLKIMQEAQDLYSSKFENLTAIYHWSTDFWTTSKSKKMRDLTSLVFDNNLGERLSLDIKKFLADRQWYKERGLPHHLNVLLYGPPGNGKSSLIAALANELKMNVSILSLTKTDDSQLREAIRSLPYNSILVMEDVDTFFRPKVNKKERTGMEGSFITFSAFLNMLDGIDGLENQICVMTTNHRECLDPALLRPGRVDRNVLVDNASSNQAYELFLRFNPESKVEAKLFASKIKNGQYNVATLQKHLLEYRDNPKLASERPIMDDKIKVKKKSD